MNATKQTAKIVGILFLTVNGTFLLGTVLLESILSEPDYLLKISENETRVLIGVLLELTNGVAYIGIALLMYPILKKHNDSIALGYVGFRFVEFVMQILTDLSPLSLVTLSQEFVQAGAPEVSSFQTLGTLLLAERDWAFKMVTIAFSLGALMFYYLLDQLKLLPRFITVWGLIGSALVLINDIMLGLFITTPEFLGILMLANELFLGVWLIVKGFNSPAVASKS